MVVVMDESEDLASNSPPREDVLTSPGSLFLLLWYSIGWERDARCLTQLLRYTSVPSMHTLP